MSDERREAPSSDWVPMRNFERQLRDAMNLVEILDDMKHMGQSILSTVLRDQRLRMEYQQALDESSGDVCETCGEDHLVEAAYEAWCVVGNDLDDLCRRYYKLSKRAKEAARGD